MLLDLIVIFITALGFCLAGVGVGYLSEPGRPPLKVILRGLLLSIDFRRFKASLKVSRSVEGSSARDAHGAELELRQRVALAYAKYQPDMGRRKIKKLAADYGLFPEALIGYIEDVQRVGSIYGGTPKKSPNEFSEEEYRLLLREAGVDVEGLTVDNINDNKEELEGQGRTAGRAEADLNNSRPDYKKLRKVWKTQTQLSVYIDGVTYEVAVMNDSPHLFKFALLYQQPLATSMEEVLEKAMHQFFITNVSYAVMGFDKVYGCTVLTASTYVKQSNGMNMSGVLHPEASKKDRRVPDLGPNWATHGFVDVEFANNHIGVAIMLAGEVGITKLTLAERHSIVRDEGDERVILVKAAQKVFGTETFTIESFCRESGQVVLAVRRGEKMCIDIIKDGQIPPESTSVPKEEGGRGDKAALLKSYEGCEKYGYYDPKNSIQIIAYIKPVTATTLHFVTRDKTKNPYQDLLALARHWASEKDVTIIDTRKIVEHGYHVLQAFTALPEKDEKYGFIDWQSFFVRLKEGAWKVDYAYKWVDDTMLVAFYLHGVTDVSPGPTMASKIMGRAARIWHETEGANTYKRVIKDLLESVPTSKGTINVYKLSEWLKPEERIY